ncbi:MAG: tyrosine-type recombinase/integrase [Gaiellales bacterium]
MAVPRHPGQPRRDQALRPRHTLRQLGRWQKAIGVRDETGQPVRVHAHQFRHTVGTRLINAGVPQHVIQKLLGHTRDGPSHGGRTGSTPSLGRGLHLHQSSPLLNSTQATASSLVGISILDFQDGPIPARSSLAGAAPARTLAS